MKKITDTSEPGVVRKNALLMLVLLAVVFTLYHFSSLFLPIFLALLVSAILSPIVNVLKTYLKLPDAVSAAVVLLVSIAVIGAILYRLMVPASEWIQRAPSLMQNIRYKLVAVTETIKEAQQATQKLEDITDATKEKEPKVVAAEPTLAGKIFEKTKATAANLAIIIVLLYFLLARGRSTLQRLETSWESGEQWVLFITQIQRDIAVYLGTYTIINATLGLITGFTLWMLEVPNPFLWGAMAAVLNYVPYLGSATVIFILAAVSIVTFDSWPRMVLPPAIFFLYTALEGQFITPFILGSRLTLNPIFVFISIFFWGWVWGIPGILIAVPVLITVKVVSANLPALKPIHDLIR